jgi:trehalose 6-phosphate phosphatase
MIPAELARALAAFAARPRVIVGLDFDGVLAPIVVDRDAARALPGSMEAVRALAGLPETSVLLVSGRALDSLAAVSGVGPDDPIGLIGSHGAETSLRHPSGGQSPTIGMTPEDEARLREVVDAVRAIARTDSTLDVELKPTGVVLHTRQAAPEVAARAEEQALSGPGAWPGVHAIRGKAVVELAVVETSKGLALQRLRSIDGTAAVLYAGDDVTDETAFAVLAADDVGVKVGPGDTRATYRVDGPEDVRELLQRLVAERSQR